MQLSKKKKEDRRAEKGRGKKAAGGGKTDYLMTLEIKPKCSGHFLAKPESTT